MTAMFLWLSFRIPASKCAGTFTLYSFLSVINRKIVIKIHFIFMRQRLSTQLAKDMVLQNYYA
jgi:hypothetical protein